MSDDPLVKKLRELEAEALGSGVLYSFLAVVFTALARWGWNGFDPEHIMLIGTGIFGVFGVLNLLQARRIKRRTDAALIERGDTLR